jgi:hypothetical protein
MGYIILITVAIFVLVESNSYQSPADEATQMLIWAIVIMTLFVVWRLEKHWKRKERSGLEREARQVEREIRELISRPPANANTNFRSPWQARDLPNSDGHQAEQLRAFLKTEINNLQKTAAACVTMDKTFTQFVRSDSASGPPANATSEDRREYADGIARNRQRARDAEEQGRGALLAASQLEHMVKEQTKTGMVSLRERFLVETGKRAGELLYDCHAAEQAGNQQQAQVIAIEAAAIAFAIAMLNS